MELKTARETGLRTATPPVPKHDEMPLLGIDHLELYVGNGIQAAHHALGFRETAFAGLETGMRDRGLPSPRAGADPLPAHLPFTAAARSPATSPSTATA